MFSGWNYRFKARGMIEKYKGRVKFAGLLIVLPLLVLGSGVGPTLRAWRWYAGQKERLEKMKGNEEEFLEEDGGMTGGRVLSNGLILEQLRVVAGAAGVRVVGYTPYFTRQEGEWEVYSGELVLAGEYIPLLRVVHDLEKRGGPEKIVSACFRIVPEVNRREEELRLTLWLQAIERNR